MEDRSAKLLLGGIFVVLLLGILAVIPIREKTEKYSLATLQSIKQSAEDSLFQDTGTRLSFLVQEKNGVVAKIISYSGDIHCEEGNNNYISYKVKYNIYGNLLDVTDVNIEYNKTPLSE